MLGSVQQEPAAEALKLTATNIGARIKLGEEGIQPCFFRHQRSSAKASSRCGKYHARLVTLVDEAN